MPDFIGVRDALRARLVLSSTTRVQGQRARRIEMLLAHEFHARKFMLPDRLSAKERDRQARANGEEAAETTAGGEHLVLRGQ